MDEVASVVTDPGAADNLLQMGMNTGMVGIIAAVIGGIIFMFIRRKSNTGIKGRKQEYADARSTANVALGDNNTKQAEVQEKVEQTSKDISTQETVIKDVIADAASVITELLNPNNPSATTIATAELKKKDNDLWRTR